MVIDSSIFIEFLRAKNKTKTTLFSISDETELFISSITLYELLIGATNTQKIKDVEVLLKGVTIIPFDDNISIKASEIYHQLRLKNKMIEFRDIFIAATCLQHNMPIKTLNKKHFNRIENLLVE
jgi:tRNA(fMet)-specific endonuclease VapC